MATKTLYPLNSLAQSPNYFGNMQDGGTAPTEGASGYGWSVSAVVQQYYRARFGASGFAAERAMTTYLDSANPPIQGTGSTETTSGDSFRIGPLNGGFAAGNWTLAFGFKPRIAATAGRIRSMVWRGSDASGAGASVLSGTLVGNQITLSQPTAPTPYVSSVVWSAPAITLSNEYLFFKAEWFDGGAQPSYVEFWQGSNSSIVTTDFTPGGVTPSTSQISVAVLA